MQNNHNDEANEKKEKRGEMIAVCSAKGGVGRTVLTVNLALALFKKNIKISILDGDFQFGDVSLALDLQNTFTIKDVAEEIDQMDEYSLASYFNHHESGVKVLAAPERPEYADLVTEEVINKVTEMMLKQHDYLLVDTGVGLSEKSLHFVEKADQILLITNLEMATLKNTKLMLETLDMLGLRHKVQLVINRATMDSVIKASDVPDILSEESPIYIPNDFQIVSQSINIGIPFVMNQGKSEVAKSVFKMAEQLSTRREIKTYQTKEGSFLSKLVSKGKKIKKQSALF
jgi:pilus assembly protein CpaE